MIKIILFLFLFTNSFLYAEIEEYCKKDIKETPIYIKCLVKGLDKNTSVKNMNFLAGVYVQNKRYKDAEDLFLKAVKKGSVEALYQIGSLNSGFIKNDKRAIKYYLKAAKKGDMRSAHNLGVKYHNMWELDEAIYWYEIASKSGDNNSTLGLAQLYKEDRKFKKAIAIYTKLGESGDSRGYHNLGLMYIMEKKLKDLKKAESYLMKCYKLNDGKCTKDIGNLYRDKKEYEIALKWYKKAIDLNYNAQLAIGLLYEDYLKDVNKAIEWYIKGYAIKDKGATYNLAYLYKNTLKDNDKAIEWYKKLHKLGDSAGSYSLGLLYKEVLKDYIKAEKWYKTSHNLGFPTATYNLGYLYEDSFKDNKKAIIWYKKALDLGVYQAKRDLKRLGVTNE